MFAFVGWAAGTNGFCIPKGARWWRPWTWLGKKPGRWAAFYRLVPFGMLVSGIVTVAALHGTGHQVLWLEVVEVAWFVVFWIAQSVEQWDDGIRPQDAVGTSA